LDAGKALDVMDCIPEHTAQDVADPGHGLEPVQGRRVVLLGCLNDRSLDIAEPLIVVADQREVSCHTFLRGRSGKPLGNVRAMGFGGQFLPALREVVRAVRVLDRREQCGPLTGQGQTAPQQLAGGTHLGGGDGGLGEPPAAEEQGNFLRVNLVIFRFASRDSLHIQSMAQHAGNAFASTEVGEPIPGEETCDAHDQVLPIGRHGLEKWVRSCLHVPVD
jgi:hypothetical protein